MNKSKVEEIVLQGLVSGVGSGVPGDLCVMSAIKLAYGEPHGDDPSCVHEDDRRLGMILNDRFVGTPKERAAFMLPLGLAALGTAGKDRSKWNDYICEQNIRRILPVILDRAGLTKEADHCRAEGTKESALKARGVARAAYEVAYDVAGGWAVAAAYAAAVAVGDAVASASAYAASSDSDSDSVAMLAEFREIVLEAYAL